MTILCEMIMECRAIKGIDKLVLYGWSAQLEDGNDMVSASKATVAEFLGVSEDTVLRRTQALIKEGWLIDTGEQKQWEFARTPVRIINVPVIVALVEAQSRKLRPCLEAPPQKAPPQFAAQGSGSTGSLVLGLDLLSLSSHSITSATGVPPVVVKSAPLKNGLEPKTENLQTKTIEPKSNPTPHAHGQGKLCPDCGEPLQRDVNHFLTCKIAKGRCTLDEYPGDMPRCPKPMDEMEFEDWDCDGKPLFPKGESEEARRRVEAEHRRSVESILEEGRARARANTSHARPPVAPASPHPTKRCSACGGVEPCIDKWCYAYEPLPKSVEEIRPTGITP